MTMEKQRLLDEIERLECVIDDLRRKREDDPNTVSVEALRAPSWESSLVYGTLARMKKDGIDTQAVYAASKITHSVDLRVVINGYEYPAIAFIERWKTEFDYQVAKEARRLVAADHKISALLEDLHETVDEIRSGLCDAARKAFPHADLDRE